MAELSNMINALYPLHVKDTRIIVIGKSKYKGMYGIITANAWCNTQSYFNLKLDDGTRIKLHAESLKIST